ncbi:MAG: short-chain fatty acyl-CoA regulator family protein [Devosiaceae bacterium]|nr:short-chain fatty acyl-CoA regulator family protein [Devosiaceae bacterium]
MDNSNATQIGGKIRRLRRGRNISQANLAQNLSISASYLNLIEHNRRKITVPLLFKLANFFGVEVGELAQTDDSQLVGDLMEIFGDDLFIDSDLTNQDIRDLALTNPVAARAVLSLFDKYKQIKTNQLASTNEKNSAIVPYHQATDAISDFIQENANYYASLEQAAMRVRHDVDIASDNFMQGLTSYLLNVFGIRWRLANLEQGINKRLTDDETMLEISDILPPETAKFTLAHHIGQLSAKAEIDNIIENSTLPELEAPTLARNVLASYFAAALIMPYESFYLACKKYRYDIERISLQFGASFEQVCHRMTSLQRPNMKGIPLHLIRTDIAGNISKRFSLSGIHIPRHSGACPRWNVYAAFLQPSRTNIQISEMPDKEKYFCIAKSFEKGEYHHNAPLRHFSIGLGCNIMHAKAMIYSDGIELGKTAKIVPIGVGCRICPRINCQQRAHPIADHRFVKK